MSLFQNPNWGDFWNVSFHPVMPHPPSFFHKRSNAERLLLHSMKRSEFYNLSTSVALAQRLLLPTMKRSDFYYPL